MMAWIMSLFRRFRGDPMQEAFGDIPNVSPIVNARFGWME